MSGSDELESVPMERFITYPYPDAILYSDLGGVITRGTSWHFCLEWLSLFPIARGTFVAETMSKTVFGQK